MPHETSVEDLRATLDGEIDPSAARDALQVQVVWARARLRAQQEATELVAAELAMLEARLRELDPRRD